MKNDLMNTFEAKDFNIIDIDILENNRGLDVCSEAWFDVDKKFGLNTRTYDDIWLNIYIEYYPLADNLEDTIKFIYVISKPDEEIVKTYTPHNEEILLLIELIKKYCKKEMSITPIEYLVS